MEDAAKRIEKNPLLLLAPGLFQKEITKLDSCFFKNAAHLRTFIQQAIDERKDKFDKGFESDSASDMVGILLQDE